MGSRLAVMCTLWALAGCQDDPEGQIGGGVDATATAPERLAVSVEAPLEGQPLAGRLVEVRGRATGGAERVEVFVDDGPAVRAAGRESWSAVLELAPGRHELRVVATLDEATVEVKRVYHQGRTIALEVPAPGAGEIELRLDRFALERLLTPADQRRVVLTWLDLAPLVRNALAALGDPEAWGLDTSAWGPAERNLARLVTITPDDADVSGSALAPLLDLGERLGLAPPRVFADLLDLAPTDPILATDVVAGALVDQVIRSHPAFQGDASGRIAVTLEDALTELRSFADRYGPSGDHPGFVAAPPRAELFTPAFAMIVRGHGNVRVRPGLRPGEGFAAHVEPPPAGAPILDLDFEDPRRFRVEGLAPEPRVGLEMELREDPLFFDVGPSDAPGPRGASKVWLAPDWTVERLVAEAAFRAFSERFEGERVLTYDLGAVSPAATLTWDAGFVTVQAAADLGPPPPPAWFWDLVLDVAQARLHDGGLAEGDVRARLALPPLPIGLDAEELVASMRPVLHEKRAELVELMVGAPESLESRATIWLDEAGPTLHAIDGSAGFHTDASLTGEGIRSIPLTSAAQVWWTRSPEGGRHALLVGPWADGRVEVGLVAVPET